MDPYGKVVTAMRRPATLVLGGLAATAVIARAFRAPFPGPGGNRVLDLIAYHDPAFHTAIGVWYYAAPAVAVQLANSIGLSVSRARARPWKARHAPGSPARTSPARPALREFSTAQIVQSVIDRGG